MSGNVFLFFLIVCFVLRVLSQTQGAEVALSICGDLVSFFLMALCSAPPLTQPVLELARVGKEDNYLFSFSRLFLPLKGIFCPFH
jgi:hypothetical protein